MPEQCATDLSCTAEGKGSCRLPARWGERAIVGFMLGLILVLNVSSVRRKSLTTDEPFHLEYGLKVLLTDSARFDDSKMPVSALNALALLSELKPAATQMNISLEGIQRARLVTTVFSLILALLVYAWTRQMYGKPAAMLALTTYAFAPNILAHSRLITTDLYAALAVTLTLFCFWNFTKVGGTKWALASALALGGAQVCKYSCIFLFPILALILVVRRGPELSALARQRSWRELRRLAGAFAGYSALFLAVTLVAINLGFLFNRSFTPLEDYEFRSSLFQSCQKRLSFAGRLPVPLPYPYLQGLDLCRFIERQSTRTASRYLLGELRQNHGFGTYYLVAFLFKVPLGLQALLALAAWRGVRRRAGPGFRRDEVFLILPFLFYFAYLSFLFRYQVGIRFFILVFPLMHIFAASILRDSRGLGRKARGVAAGLVAIQAASVLSYHPHYLPYFNELVWNRLSSHKILADSNLDWGQDRVYLNEYLAAHPDAVLNPSVPTSGKIVVRANDLVGLTEPNRYAWLREGFEPVEHIAYSYLVFEIEPGPPEAAKPP